MKKYNLTENQLKEIFIAGFNCSEEGFNGEYPFDISNQDIWDHEMYDEENKTIGMEFYRNLKLFIKD